MTHQQEVADRLAQLRREKSVRERRDVLQAEIAEAVGISPVTYGRYEGGKRKIPEEVVSALADYYGVTREFIRYGVAQTIHIAGLEIDLATLQRIPDEELARGIEALRREEAERATPPPHRRTGTARPARHR